MSVNKAMFLEVLGACGNMEIVKIYAGQPLVKMPSSVACIGYFDGVHVGHQKLIEKVNALAQKEHVKTACICFDNDPWIVMKKCKETSQLTPLALRLKKLETLGIQICYLLHFDEAMMKLEPSSFVNDILSQLHLEALVCGEDFRFAYQGKGSTRDLMNAHFALHIVEEIQYQGHKISSSHIEKLLKAGAIAKANAQLGYEYTLSGEVIHGNKVGAKVLGFATANLALDEDYVMVKKGVYAAHVTYHGKVYKSMVNLQKDHAD